VKFKVNKMAIDAETYFGLMIGYEIANGKCKTFKEFAEVSKRIIKL